MADDQESFANFLERQDTIHLIVDIGVEPRRYSDLAERVSIKESALSNRLTTGVKLDVWRKDIVETVDGDERVYRLDKTGEVARLSLDDELTLDV